MLFKMQYISEMAAYTKAFTGLTFLWDMNNTKWCDGFYIQFRQSFAKETFSYDEHLKS